MNNDHPPPKNETGGSNDPARLLKSATAETVIGQLREINGAAPKIWVAEGWRLLAQYQSTGNPKHLSAFCAHVAGMRARMGGLRKSISTEEALQ